MWLRFIITYYPAQLVSVNWVLYFVDQRKQILSNTNTIYSHQKLYNLVFFKLALKILYKQKRKHIL